MIVCQHITYQRSMAGELFSHHILQPCFIVTVGTFHCTSS